MKIAMFIIGFLIGLIFGTTLFCIGQASVDKANAENGVAKLNGKLYKLTEIGDADDR